MNRRVSDRLSGRVEPPATSGQVAHREGGANTNDSAVHQLSHLRHPRRLTVARLASITDRLDERDLAVVATLARIRMATGSQLHRLHFHQLPSSERQARRILRRLVGLDVLACQDRTVGGRRAGSTGFIYALGLVGQRLAGGRGPAKGSRIQRPWTPSAPYLSHLLLVSELYVQLEEAVALGALDLLEFEAEPACWRSFVGAGGARLWLKPDAFLRIGVGETERLHFVEVDRATESPRTLDRKLVRYASYAASGAETAAWGVHPFVSWLVPDRRRAEVVLDACRRTPAQLSPLFQVATFDQAVGSLLGEVS